MKTLILAAAIGLLLVTVYYERGAAATAPDVSPGTAISAQTAPKTAQIYRPRCTRLLRRCNRGNIRACQLYRAECRLFRPII